ncbi:MAG: MATE family efflux transporter [Clostridia bacterium]|nr:MATE family efflux transporter [Clostridia bacterium]
MFSKAKRRTTDVDMTEGSIVKHLISFAIPLLIGNLFQMMYNMVDTWVVGRFVSDAAFSAVGTLGSVTNLMIGFFIGLTSGAGVVISRFFGAKNYDKVKDTVNTSIIMTGVLCVLFTALGLALIPVFLLILDMPQDVRAEAVTYLSIWFSGLSGLMIYNMGSAIMRAVGDSRRPFIYLVVAAVTNTVLDLVFVIVFKWGVAGVAIATIIAQGLSATLTVISLCRNESCVRISFKGMRFHTPIFKEILVIGLPAALQMTITSFSNIFVQSYINFFGKEVMGGWTAYTKIDQIILLPMQSLALASTTFVGQNIGQNQVKRAEKGANTALIMSLISTGILIIPVMLFSGTFVSIFNKNPDIIANGTLFLRWLTPFYLFWCVNQIYSGALRGVGKSTGPMIIMLSSFVAFRQTYLFVVSNYISNTILPIAMAFPAGWALSAIVTIIYYKITGLTPKVRKPKTGDIITA